MLVVDLVIRRFGDHVADVRIFEYEDTIRFEQTLHAGGHAGQIGNVAHHIRRQDRIGATVLDGDVVGEFAIEKSANGGYALSARNFGDIGRRLDAEVTQAAVLKVP